MPPTPTPNIRTITLTALAMTAFAANSLLCRRALGDGLIDPATFTAVRIASGAVVLLGLLQLRGTPRDQPGAGAAAGATASSVDRTLPDHLSPVMLIVYAAGFSYAYLRLDAGTGALVLFGMVQVTMFTASVRSGVRPSFVEWGGLVAAMGGLAWLVAPGLSAPDPVAAGVMALAGIGWGVYSLRGRGTTDPIRRTARNFAGAVPAALLLLGVHAIVADLMVDRVGLILAVASGAITSGVGYVIWYAALPGLSAVRASLVQLSVPVITAVLAIPLLGESVSPRLLVGGGLVIGGIAAAILGRR